MNYNEAIEKARDLNNAGDFRQAIELFESIREEGKNDSKWYYRYAFALLYSNRFKDAIELLESNHLKVLQVNDNYPFTYLILGQLYYWQGNLVEAFKMVEKGMEICKEVEPMSVWEFEQVLESMFEGRPFANREDWSDSIISNDFEDYDENADNFYKFTEDDYNKQKEDLQAYFGNYERKRLPVSLFINARLQPKHRHNLEDILDCKLSLNKLGMVDGGGSFLDKDKRVSSCDINFDIYPDEENYKERFLDIIKKNTSLPKGSTIEFFYEEDKTERINLGEYDILALGLDSYDLPDEVYENYSILEVIQKIKFAFEEEDKYIGYFYYDETEGRFWLRFLGHSYAEMKELCEKAIKDYPLCENAIFVNESNGK